MHMHILATILDKKKLNQMSVQWIYKKGRKADVT